jgi:pyruvate formate lyase activating enzyme
MVDVKHIDPDVHRDVTGVSSERILANARRLAQTGKPVIIRVPVVPTVNDTPEQIAGIANFVQSLVGVGLADSDLVADLISLELLPFHRLASDKYRSLDLEYRASHLEPPTRERMAELVEAASACSVTVRCR